MVNNSYSSHGGGFAFFPTFNKSESFLVVESSVFSGNPGSCIWGYIIGDNVVIYINNSSFTDSKPSKFDITVDTIAILSDANSSTITFINVNIANNIVAATELGDGSAAAVSLFSSTGDFEVNMIRVNFTSNEYLGRNGGALFVGPFDGTNVNFLLHITECVFIDNKSSGHGAALYVFTELSAPQKSECVIQICSTLFDRNVAGYSVLYFPQIPSSEIEIQINNSIFTNNIGSSMYMSSSTLHLIDNVLFENNTAENGAAVYLDQGGVVEINDNATIQFVNNFASHIGGAIYIDMISTCQNAFTYSITPSDLSNVTFTNNTAGFAGNSLYVT